MSSALNIIIARGFGPEVRDVTTSYQRGKDIQREVNNDQRQADQLASARDFDLQSAQQKMTDYTTDRTRLQGFQTEADAITAKIAALEPTLQQYARSGQPIPQEVAAEVQGLYSQLQRVAFQAQPVTSLTDLLKPQGSAGERSLVKVVENGKVVYRDQDSAVGSEAYVAAPSPSAPSFARAEVMGPDGRPIVVGYNTKDPNQTVPLGAVPPPPPSAADVKAQREARQKLPRMNALDRRLDRMDNAVKAVSSGFVNTGPVDKYAIQFTAAGQEMIAASSQLLDELTALTRIPGVGSQSDLETRLKALTLPSIDLDPEVNKRNAEEIRAFAKDLREAIESVAAGSGAQADPLGIR